MASVALTECRKRPEGRKSRGLFTTVHAVEPVMLMISSAPSLHPFVNQQSCCTGSDGN